MAHSAARPSGLTSARRVLGSSCGRVLRASTPSIIIAAILVAAQAGLSTVSPLMLQRIIDSLTQNPSTASVLLPGLLAAGAAVASTAVGVASQRMTAFTGQRFQERLRVLMLSKLTRLSSSTVSAAPGGSLLSQITNDTAQAQTFVSTILPQALGLIARLGLLLSIMWTRSFTITLVVLALALILAVPTERVSRTLSATTDRMLDAMSVFSGTVVERVGVTGHLFSRTAADIPTDRRQAEEAAAGVRTSFTRMITLNSAFSSSLDLVGALGTVAVLIIGGHSVVQGDMTPGALAALAALTPQLYAPLQAASGVRTGLATSWSALSRVSGFLESQEEWYEAPPVPVDVPNGGALLVRETDYSVAAGTSSTVLLDSVSLTARCGEIVAIVGPSGSGKSTLLSLIAGANHPSQGSITVAGFSPVVTGTEAWNSIVQYCPQEPFFRSGTLKENFEAVCPGISEARIHELCSRVGLDLSRLGDRSGTSTMLGERGARISGGERARLAIARTLALNPRVLLLDEPTAALDDESTDHLIATLLNLKRDHCIVVTTHDARLFAMTDRAYRMEFGRLREVPTPTLARVEKGVPA
ncbi:ABC transporter ATP-binding protein [Actinomyces oris]|uniref:ABC transporter ATP-binding protein n=1 Tax=Actinomyces oris TaxID=544580 RepID=A0A508BEK8_9ACTO|nr:ABC transporter ATP-binding protein [Actinomyces oris]QQC39059.1 ABC transporter ATP-binding protein [Actinomyces oris]TQD59733.1 ABC transporter ATP-binding protein [Actinomyces oris]